MHTHMHDRACIYACTHTRIHDSATHMHAHIHAYTHTCMHTHIHTQHTCMHTHATYMHTHIHDSASQHLLCLTALCRECNHVRARFRNRLVGCSLKVTFADICLIYTLHNQIETVGARKFDTYVLCKSNG
jgi:hypothetical protein